MEPAPIGAAKDGAAGSVIVAKRRDSRVQRRASSAAAAAILQPLAWRLHCVYSKAMEIGEVFCEYARVLKQDVRPGSSAYQLLRSRCGAVVESG